MGREELTSVEGSNMFLRSKYSLGCPIASTGAAATTEGATKGETRAAVPNPVAPAASSGLKLNGLTRGVAAGGIAVPRSPSAGAAGFVGKVAAPLRTHTEGVKRFRSCI